MTPGQPLNHLKRKLFYVILYKNLRGFWVGEREIKKTTLFSIRDIVFGNKYFMVELNRRFLTIITIVSISTLKPK